MGGGGFRIRNEKVTDPDEDIYLRIHNIACGLYVVCFPESNIVDKQKLLEE